MEPRNQKIVGLGEVLWDVFPDGPRFGGAPANFACSSAALAGDTADALMVSSVGNDDLGNKALQELADRNVDTSHVSQQDKQTGQVTIQLDDQGCASYEFAADTAWDNLQWTDELAQLAIQADAVCFGSLGQRSEQSRETIHRFVSSTAPSALRIFDINLRPPFYNEPGILESLKIATVLKLNEDELPFLARLCNISGTPVEMLHQLATANELRAIALTRGSDGSILLRDGEVSQRDGEKTEIVDTVGARRCIYCRLHGRNSGEHGLGSDQRSCLESGRIRLFAGRGDSHHAG